MKDIKFELLSSDSVVGRSTRGHCAQQLKTHFQCGNAYFDVGYAHIVSITMSDAVLNIFFPC